jgi:hypothetical protein
MSIDIPRSVQRALLGEVPATLRFVYAYFDGNVLHYHAVFTDDATDEEVECAHVALAEVISDCPPGIRVQERIERNSLLHWRIGTGENLLFLRYGELSE